MRTAPVALLVAALAAPASAKPREGHLGQVMLSLRTAVGLRALVPYDGADYCGQSDPETTSGNAPVCTGRAPMSFDLEAGYGVDRKVDLLLELRIGVESDFGATSNADEDGPRMFHLSPGARFFFSDSPTMKLFTTGQLVIDFAGYDDASGEGRGTDFGIRNMNGLWFDIKDNYSAYVYVGETLTLARWLRFELEGGVGIAYRYP
jgi:hypothetical protein